LTFSKLLSQSILALFLHFGVELSVCSTQLLFDLTLEHNLSTLVVIVLATEVFGQLTWIISFINFNALNSSVFRAIRIHLNEK
jgi:hypothetical protein